MLAQVEPLSMQTLGMLVVALIVLGGILAALLSMAVQVKSLFWPTPPSNPRNEPVTRGDLDSAMKEIQLRIETFATREMITALSGRVLALEQTQASLGKEAQESAKEFRAMFQDLSMRLQAVQIALRCDHGADVKAQDRSEHGSA